MSYGHFSNTLNPRFRDTLPVTGETRFIFMSLELIGYLQLYLTLQLIESLTSLTLVVNSGILELAEMEGNQYVPAVIGFLELLVFAPGTIPLTRISQ